MKFHSIKGEFNACLCRGRGFRACPSTGVRSLNQFPLNLAWERGRAKTDLKLGAPFYQQRKFDSSCMYIYIYVYINEVPFERKRKIEDFVENGIKIISWRIATIRVEAKYSPSNRHLYKQSPVCSPLLSTLNLARLLLRPHDLIGT